MLVCRGCCCGTSDKHPHVEHAGHLARLTAAATASSTKLWTVHCLGPCERANVVVVRTGAQRRWFGEMLGDADIESLAGWVGSGASAPLPADLREHEFTPDTTAPMVAAPVQLRAGALADVVYDLLRDGGSSWILGVHGAAAEFEGSDQARIVTRSGSAVLATTATASLRVDLGDDALLYSLDRPGTHEPVLMILAVDGSHALPGRCVITDLGVDIAAIHPGRDDTTLFDLGIGRRAATFGVRASGDLAQLLRRHLGQTFDAAVVALAAEPIDESPVCVVETPLARLEVAAPIQATGSPSPSCWHDHLLQGALDLGLDLPPGICLPDGLTPAAIIRPPSGWTLPEPAAVAPTAVRTRVR